MPHPRGESGSEEGERSRFIQTLSHSVRLAKTRLSILARPCVHPSPFLLLSSLPSTVLFIAFYLRLAAPSCPFFVPGPRLYPPHQHANTLFARSRLLEDVSVAGSAPPRGHVELESLGPSHDPMTDGSIQRIRDLLENRDFVWDETKRSVLRAVSRLIKNSSTRSEIFGIFLNRDGGGVGFFLGFPEKYR